MNSPAAIVIRDIETIAEMREVEELQKKIWGVTDRDVVPALVFKPFREVGAILVGAFAENRIVGFVFGVPGLLDGEIVIHSDMLGVLPEFRSYSLGYLLKLAQRERALALNIDTISWTFDPLQSRNAHLNFAKLGVVADRYEVNFYGETSSVLHQNGTDRLWVTWRLNSKRVTDRIALHRAAISEPLDKTKLLAVGDNLEPQLCGNEAESEVVIEIPRDLQQVRNQELLMRWREATRHSFQWALRSGYLVVEYLVANTGSTEVGHYVLRKRPLP